MAGHQTHHPLLERDPRDPQFPQKAVMSNSQTQCELMETIVATRETIATSKALLAEADRILGQR